MRKYFGTDGIRGVVGKALTPELAFRCAASCGHLIKRQNPKAKVILGSDTRISRGMLTGAMISGFCYSGVNVIDTGILPTPALAFLIDRMGADAGVMISASHNPFEYNGLKILTKGGIKLPDEKEQEIEALMDDFDSVEPCRELGNLSYNMQAKDFYLEHLKQACEQDLSSFKVLLDCSNGATSNTAAEVFGDLNVEYKLFGHHPNGLNINDGCGSTHMEYLAEKMGQSDAHIGFAFDGDADRCLAVDTKGRIIEGDKIMAVIALYLKELGRLKNNTLVATVMSNLGLIEKMNQNHINVPCTKVGDRYVLEEMMDKDYTLGGENSGHIIFLEKATTGDGQLTAIMLLCAMKYFGMSSQQVYDIFTPYPQYLFNVTANDLQKRKLMTDDVFLADVKKAENIFGGKGRILVRPSGTEPYIRILVEGKDAAEVERTALDLKESTEIRLQQIF
ncbi:MAG: phosphoglucosamine mutase [Clostridia bacterium]|nr:phosphoglucosamine mutase [Clostridia bacterium]